MKKIHLIHATKKLRKQYFVFTQDATPTELFYDVIFLLSERSKYASYDRKIEDTQIAETKKLFTEQNRELMQSIDLASLNALCHAIMKDILNKIRATYAHLAEHEKSLIYTWLGTIWMPCDVRSVLLETTKEWDSTKSGNFENAEWVLHDNYTSPANEVNTTKISKKISKKSRVITEWYTLPKKFYITCMQATKGENNEHDESEGDDDEYNPDDEDDVSDDDE